MRIVLAVTALLLLFAVSVSATMVNVEINGHDYYGSVYTDNGEIYAAIDVVGPMLMGPQFHFDNYDVTLRRGTFTFVPPGASAPLKLELFGCVKRGAGVYAPLRPLMKLVGGSFMLAGDTVRIAYPPASTVATVPTPTPTPLATPKPSVTPSPVVRPSVSPSPVATVVPSPVPSPSPSPSPSVAETPAMTSAEIAMAEVKNANHDAIPSTGLIQRLEVYHPVSPDPSDVIPRTELAGLKVYLKKLAASDRVDVAMWSGKTVDGAPAFKKQVSGFRGQELSENAFFVRLPLSVEAGWHTVRVEVNQGNAVEYRFVTY